MALLDILAGRSASSGRVPPLAMALLGLLAYNKLKKPAGAAPAGEPGLAERLEDFFKPAAGGGPTAKGVIGALLTGMGVVMITTTIAVIIGLCVLLWWTHRID